MDKDCINRAAVKSVMAIAIHDRYNLRQVDAAIENIPAEEVKRIVHAQWLVRGRSVFCSDCEKKNGHDAWSDEAFPRYCPKCGATMDADAQQNALSHRT